MFNIFVICYCTFLLFVLFIIGLSLERICAKLDSLAAQHEVSSVKTQYEKNRILTVKLASCHDLLMDTQRRVDFFERKEDKNKVVS